MPSFTIEATDKKFIQGFAQKANWDWYLESTSLDPLMNQQAGLFPCKASQISGSEVDIVVCRSLVKSGSSVRALDLLASQSKRFGSLS